MIPRYEAHSTSGGNHYVIRTGNRCTIFRRYISQEAAVAVAQVLSKWAPQERARTGVRGPGCEACGPVPHVDELRLLFGCSERGHSAYNIMRRYRISTVDAVRALSVDDLRDMRNMGPVLMAHVKTCLAKEKPCNG